MHTEQEIQRLLQDDSLNGKTSHLTHYPASYSDSVSWMITLQLFTVIAPFKPPALQLPTTQLHYIRSVSHDPQKVQGKEQYPPQPALCILQQCLLPEQAS